MKNRLFFSCILGFVGILICNSLVSAKPPVSSPVPQDLGIIYAKHTYYDSIVLKRMSPRATVQSTTHLISAYGPEEYFFSLTAKRNYVTSNIEGTYAKLNSDILSWHATWSKPYYFYLLPNGTSPTVQQIQLPGVGPFDYRVLAITSDSSIVGDNYVGIINYNLITPRLDIYVGKKTAQSTTFNSVQLISTLPFVATFPTLRPRIDGFQIRHDWQTGKIFLAYQFIPPSQNTSSYVELELTENNGVFTLVAPGQISQNSTVGGPVFTFPPTSSKKNFIIPVGLTRVATYDTNPSTNPGIYFTQWDSTNQAWGTPSFISSTYIDDVCALTYDYLTNSFLIPMLTRTVVGGNMVPRIDLVVSSTNQRFPLVGPISGYNNGYMNLAITEMANPNNRPPYHVIGYGEYRTFVGYTNVYLKLIEYDGTNWTPYSTVIDATGDTFGRLNFIWF